ncbi:uncharacterized protein [Haliotis cracherodii]|uniref:uncharacterized protein n=1 Tax=Haliotis cracherodii TaxID=6455 RepID=UPI0039EB361C
MNCSSLSEVSSLHDAADSPSADISRLLNPSLSDDKADQITSDIGLDFGESSKFDPDSVLGSSYSLVREGDDPDDLELSITPNFETGLSCSPPSCFDNVSVSSASAISASNSSLPISVTSAIPSLTAASTGGSSHGHVPGVQLLSPLNAGPVVIGNMTAQTLVSAVLNAKKSESSQSGMNSVSVTPAAAGIWVLNTPPININPDILNLVKPVTLTSSVQSMATASVQDVVKMGSTDICKSSACYTETVTVPMPSSYCQTSLGSSLLGKEHSNKDGIHFPFGSSNSSKGVANMTEVTEVSSALHEGTHMVLKSEDTHEANPTSFLRLEDILMKNNCSGSTNIIQTEIPRVVSDSDLDKSSVKRMILSKSEGSESNSFSELFSFQDLPSNGGVTPTKQLSDCLPLTNLMTLAPDQPILQCSSSEELQEIEDRAAAKEAQKENKPNDGKEVARTVEVRKHCAPSTLIIEGLQEGSRLVKELPSHKVPILPKDTDGKEIKVTVPMTCEEKSTPVLVHLIRNSAFSSKDILYCQNITTTLTEDLGHDITDADLEDSADDLLDVEAVDMDAERADRESHGTDEPPLQLADIVPQTSPTRKKYKRVVDKDKVFKCDLCSAQFDVLGNYTRHRKIHKVNNENKYKCPTCERSFIQRCDMKRHMLIHTKQEPHKCQVCGKGYIRKSDLVVHMRFHSKDRPFKCTQCTKEYYQSGDLKRHIRAAHSQESMLSCGHCRRQYAKESTLIRHMQTQHKDIILKSLNQKLADEKNKDDRPMEQEESMETSS